MFGRSTKKRVRHWTRAGVLWLVVLAFVFSPASVGVKADEGNDDGGFRHVFVIMMENTGFNSLIGNPNAPFTNYLAATAGLASNYFGVAHPSQPNYIATSSTSASTIPSFPTRTYSRVHPGWKTSWTSANSQPIWPTTRCPIIL